MKNIFGIKKDKKTDDYVIDGKPFITKKIYNNQEIELENELENMDALDKKGSLPIYLSIIKYVSFFIIMIGIGGIAKADVSLETAYNNAPFIFYMVGGCIPLSIILFFIEKIKKSKVVNSKEYKEAIEQIDQQVQVSMETLGIPKDAESIDVFSFTYKESKNGKITINTNSLCKYINTAKFIYIKEDNLCFADAYEEVSIPLTSLVEIRKINKKAVVGGWNKEVNYKSGKYKQYKIKSNNYGSLFIKPYYAIIINDRLGEYEIFVPCYDIDVIIV